MNLDPKNLAAGIKEMRATASLLLRWADDLEKAGASVPNPAPETLPPAEPVASEPAPVKEAPAPKLAPAAKDPYPPVPVAPFEAQAVKQFLVFVCSRGYSN
jgi:hypothetical protein